MDILIGSNNFRNTNGVLTIQGKEQIVFEIVPEDDLLMLTMDLYNEKGQQIAHLRRNHWKFNVEDRFAFSTTLSSPSLFGSTPWLRLLDKDTEEIVIEASVLEGDKMQVIQGGLYTHKGQLLEITSHLCRITGVLTMFGDARDARGGTVVIG